jgi:MFS family permease
MGMGIFLEPLMAELRLSRLEVSTAYFYGTVISALLLPLTGGLYDRWGARSMIVVSSLGLGSALFYLGRCGSIVAHVESQLETTGNAVVAMTVISGGFFLARFWGQGILTMTSRATLGKWFHRKRGLASGLSGIFVAAAFASAPLGLQSLIDIHGWRDAWFLLGSVLFFGMSTLGWLLYRDNPEKCGLRMDGASPETFQETLEAPSTQPNPLSLVEFRVGQAIRTYPFWIFNLSLALPALVVTAMTFHIESFGSKAGLADGEAVKVFAPMAIFSIMSNIVGGWLSDRILVKHLLRIFLVFLALGTSGLLAFGHPAGHWCVVGGMGISGGLYSILMAVVWPRFYGRKHLGAIVSVNMSVIVLASAIGPVLFAQAEARTGNYTSAVLISVGLCLAGCLASVRLENPQRRSSP